MSQNVMANGMKGGGGERAVEGYIASPEGRQARKQ
jgi:hypothetical protein